MGKSYGVMKKIVSNKEGVHHGTGERGNFRKRFMARIRRSTGFRKQKAGQRWNWRDSIEINCGKM